MYSIKIEDITDGDYRPWDAALGSIREFNGVIIETLLGEKVLINSEAELKKYFNIQ